MGIKLDFSGKHAPKIMLRIIERHGAADTAKYFDASLATTDYYVRECGTWAGKGAERLVLRIISK